jgi:hypothetical protein
MKSRKPDIMTLLVFVIGLGVLATGFAQDYMRKSMTVETAQTNTQSVEQPLKY